MTEGSDPTHIRAWQRLDERTTTSGMLKADDLAELARLGVTHVINLAMADHPEALADEGQRLAAHGIRYTHLPVPFDAPDETHFAAFCAALENGDGPVHVHCVMNWRVSAFFYRYHRDRTGMEEPSARAMMAQQWTPETSAYPGAEAWVRFIAGTGA